MAKTERDLTDRAIPQRGPLAGERIPLHGGRPDRETCGGCIDCCHLPEISVNDDEAQRLQQIYAAFDEPLGKLVLRDDANHEGWQVMQGPCVFRRYDQPLQAGGCRIYEDRPGSCVIFTCRLRTELKRRG